MHAAMQAPEVSPEAYFQIDAASERRLEYEEGIVIPLGDDPQGLAGARWHHNIIKDGFAALLRQAFRPQGCHIISSDQRTQIAPSKRFYYPDVVVVCGKPEFLEKGDALTLLNPYLIVEVLSPSTAERDRGRKLDAYLEVETLREYWIAFSEQPHVIRYARNESSWIITTHKGRDAVIKSDRYALSLADIYYE